MRISRTTRSCPLHIKGYGTYHAGAAFSEGPRRTIAPTPPLPAEHLDAVAQRWFSLRLDVYPPSQVLQITGCLYHFTPASPLYGDIMSSRAPLLHGRYPASPLLRAQPSPSRLQPISRDLRLYGLPCSTDFAVGRGGLLQLLGVSLSPCCPYHPAGVDDRLSQLASAHTAFVRREKTQPPDSISCRGHLWVHSRCGPVTRSPSRRWLCRSASRTRFPSFLRSKLRGL